jgi:hypothetical protein
MSNSLRDTIKIILEAEFPEKRISQLPTKDGKRFSPTGDEGAHRQAYARATVDNIKDKFAALGITDLGDVDIMPYESMHEPFNIRFKLKNKSPFFEVTEFEGKAVMNKKETKNKKTLVLVLKTKSGEVNMIFAKGSTNDMVPQVDELQVKGIREGGEYGVTFSRGGLSGAGDEVKPGYYEYITNKGKKFIVSPIGDQSDVKEGWVLVQNVKTKRRFAVEKTRIKPETKTFQNKIKITYLGWKSMAGKDFENSEDESGSKSMGYKPINVRGGIKLEDKGKDDEFFNWLGIEKINQELSSGGQIRASQKNDGTFILTLPSKKGDNAIVLRPLKKLRVKDLKSIINWNNLEVEIGRKAMGDNKFTGTKGTITLK